MEYFIRIIIGEPKEIKPISILLVMPALLLKMDIQRDQLSPPAVVARLDQLAIALTQLLYPALLVDVARLLEILLRLRLVLLHVSPLL